MSLGPALDVFEVGGATVAELVGGVIASERDATDVVGNAGYLGADHVLLSADRLGSAFVDLSTGLAGAVVQKFVDYGLRLVVIGDLAEVGSESWRAFVRESNRGGHVWFVADREEALARIARGSPQSRSNGSRSRSLT